jgi:branched-chain amino acid transport system ATP-binding protein
MVSLRRRAIICSHSARERRSRGSKNAVTQQQFAAGSETPPREEALCAEPYTSGVGVPLPLIDEVLVAEQITLRFAGLVAVDGLSFTLRAGELLGIIGPNGAGKTSVLNCINGFYHPQRGRIAFAGREITRMAPHLRARLGIGRTFQNIALYPGMSVLANITSGRLIHMRAGLLASGIYWGPAEHELLRHRVRVEEIIDFLEMEEYRHHRVAELAYGIQKKVELGRALAMEPRLLLLDEPMAGMSADEKVDMARYILELREVRGLPMILIEHDMGVVMDLCDRLLVIDYGRKIADGPPGEIQQHPEVLRAYVGEAPVA